MKDLKDKPKKVVLHRDLVNDISKLPDEEKSEIKDALVELSNMSMEDILANSEPVDFDDLIDENPEMAERIIKRVEQLNQKDD